MLVATLATVAVMIRNYRRVPEGNARRRIRWVVWGTLAATGPDVAVGAVWALAQATGRVAGLGAFAGPLNVANAFNVIGPIAMTYTFLKPRGMGFRIFLRLGLPHPSCQNV